MTQHHSQNKNLEEQMAHALYIGRFQPFHKGHLDVLSFIATEPGIERIIVAIGSSQYHFGNPSPVTQRVKNAFTFDERKEMILESISGIRKPVDIFPLPDFHDYDQWYAHIKKTIPSFDIFYTVNKAEQDYFIEKGHIVRSFPLIYDFTATKIRERMFKGKEYRSALPDGTLNVLDRINGVDRISKLYAYDLAERMRL